MPENPPFPGYTCCACDASPIAVYHNYVSCKCVACTHRDPLLKFTGLCIFCKKTTDQVVYGSQGSCRSCTDGFPENPATKAKVKEVNKETAKEPEVTSFLGVL